MTSIIEVAAPALGLDLRLETLELARPFRISGHSFRDVPVLVATVMAEGLQGRGEAAGVYYLDDGPEGMLQTLERQRERIEAGISRGELQEMLPTGGARNALDCALWELEARHAGVPVWRLAGLNGVKPPVTTFTLGADAPGEVASGAAALAEARALKLKLDGDLEADTARLAALRNARPDVWLAVDANQGYNAAGLGELLPALEEAEVRLLEQPLPRGDDADLAGIDCRIPLAADESVQGLSEIEPCAALYDVINIKLDKCGGLTEALQMAREARRLGLDVMVGNMVGTSLAMAPAFIVAQLCDYVDLDGPTLIRRDRSPGVRYRNGRIYCGEAVWGGPDR